MVVGDFITNVEAVQGALGRCCVLFIINDKKNLTCINLRSKCLGSCFSVKYLMLFSSQESRQVT